MLKMHSHASAMQQPLWQQAARGQCRPKTQPCTALCTYRQQGVEMPSVDYPFRQSGLDMDQNDSQGQSARSGYRPNCQPSQNSQGWIYTVDKNVSHGRQTAGVVMGCIISYPFRQSGFDIHGPKLQPWTGSNGWITGYGPYCQAFLDT
jgi:hypothetical protein